jgi:hypothetical protein
MATAFFLGGGDLVVYRWLKNLLQLHLQNLIRKEIKYVCVYIYIYIYIYQAFQLNSIHLTRSVPVFKSEVHKFDKNVEAT